MVGDNGDNAIIGTTASDVIDAMNGNDTAQGLAGNDRIYGRAGNDALYGQDGNDILNGGGGVDIASYADAAGGVTVSLANPGINTGEAEGNSFVSIEGVVGSQYADTLRGNSASNTLDGSGGRG
ncbi:hemolysin-type calcium-binding repeat family protein (plasmid) [Sinorhizobium sp. RAC02]|nr:calcium-binding protein [Sinorhizobium sp. RAC02]AOF93283.1 hemolysin-type calcium-binding repeat family protein [Sinorhizobium sp. RAC02]